MPFKYPATIPLWTERWPTAQLQKKYQESPREFRRGFQLDPMSDDERKLPHFAQAVAAGRGLTVEKLLSVSGDMVKFMGADPGGTGRPGSAVFVLGYNRGQRIPLDVKFGQWGPREFAEQIVAIYQRWLPAVVYIENNALQESYLDLVRMLPGSPVLPLWGFMTGRNKSDPTIGIEGMDSEFLQGTWTIPAGEFLDHDIGCSCDWCRWYAEVLNYPNYPTADSLMAMWFAWNALRKNETGNRGQAESVGDLDLGMQEKKENIIETDLDNSIESWDM